jgi:hypothetical protein
MAVLEVVVLYAFDLPQSQDTGKSAELFTR